MRMPGDTTDREVIDTTTKDFREHFQGFINNPKQVPTLRLDEYIEEYFPKLSELVAAWLSSLDKTPDDAGDWTLDMRLHGTMSIKPVYDVHLSITSADDNDRHELACNYIPVG